MVLPWDCTMMLRGMESQVARAFQTSVAEMLTLAMLATTIITIILATLLYQLLYWWSWSRSFRPINPLSPSWIPWSGIQPIPAPKIFISRLFAPLTGSTCTLGVVESFPVLMEKIKNPPRRNWTSCIWAGLGTFKKAMLEWVIRWKYWYTSKMATARMERWFGAPDWNCSNGLNVGFLTCFGDGCFFPPFGLHLTFFRITPLSHLHSDMGVSWCVSNLWIFRGALILRDTHISGMEYNCGAWYCRGSPCVSSAWPCFPFVPQPSASSSLWQRTIHTTRRTLWRTTSQVGLSSNQMSVFLKFPLIRRDLWMSCLKEWLQGAAWCWIFQSCFDRHFLPEQSGLCYLVWVEVWLYSWHPDAPSDSCCAHDQDS